MASVELFAYHGGSVPSSPEEVQQVMQKWQNWLGGMGDQLVDGGNPVGQSYTVEAGDVRQDGGANPVSGYSLINAENYDAAIEIAKGCPALESGGSVEVAEAIDM